VKLHGVGKFAQDFQKENKPNLRPGKPTKMG
jgi:hypothetical protein